MRPLLVRVELRAMTMKEYSALLEPHHQIVLCHMQRGESYSSAEMQSVYSTDKATADRDIGDSLGEVLPPLRGYIQCILQPQPTGPQETHWEGPNSHYSDAVCVFYSHSRQDHRRLIGRSLTPITRMHSVYSTVAADWVTEHALVGSYPSAELQSVYFTAQANWAMRYIQKVSRLNIWTINETLSKNNPMTLNNSSEFIRWSKRLWNVSFDKM